jgi:hypothetical protein
MAGESKGTEASYLGAERGGGDSQRWREMAVVWPGSCEAGGRG